MKRCLLICEGPFDELIFSILRDVFNDALFEIKPLCHCCLDVTDLEENVEKIVGEILAKEHGYSRDDFDEVCFLVDSDGIFINNELIIENKALSRADYKMTSIECPDKKSIELRNKKRVGNIDKLLSKKEHFIFYNSRNLEHAFDESMSGHLRDILKKRFSLDIFRKYESDKKMFIEKLALMNKSNQINIFKSWDFLRKDVNSLSSCSNIFIFLVMHYYALKDEYKPLKL